MPATRTRHWGWLAIEVFEWMIYIYIHNISDISIYYLVMYDGDLIPSICGPISIKTYTWIYILEVKGINYGFRFI